MTADRASQRLGRPSHRRLRALRFSFAVLEQIAPQWGAYHASRLWFRSPRHPEPMREARWRAQAEQYFLLHGERPVTVYRWGRQGPPIVLVHGWAGRGPQLGAFAQPLIAAGFQVVAFDAPAHGRSPGVRTNIFEMVEALGAVAREVGPVHGLVAHSFGALVVALALRRGMHAGRVVCISSPTDPCFLFERFCQTLGLGSRTRQLLERRLERGFGVDIWRAICAADNALELQQPALVIHDEHDADVPWQLGQRLARAWPGARFVRTRLLGHRRVLRAPRTIGLVVDFLAAGR